MRSSTTRRLRWGVPAVAATAVAGSLAAGPLMADASPKLAPRTAAQLLASTQAAFDHPFTGTVVETARLGLPELPTGNGGATSLSLASLVTGSHTARVWYAGPTRSRVALVGDLAETDVIRDGRQVWTWSSTSNTATHLRLPAETSKAPARSAADMTPDQAAKAALAAIDPTTAVKVNGTSEVAGRKAYQLLLTPRDTRSLVASVQLDVDSATSTPLAVRVYARGHAKPAFETTFSKITFATPKASTFRFSPRPGVKVSEQKLPVAAPKRQQRDVPAADRPTVIGKGWTSVVEAKGVNLTGADNAQLGALLRSAKRVEGTYGSGRVLRTALVSVLLLDDGRMFAGSVTPALLEQAAASAAAR